MEKGKMQKLLIRPKDGLNSKVFLKMLGTRFEIHVILTEVSQYFLTQTILDKGLPSDLSVFFQQSNELFEYLKQHKQTVTIGQNQIEGNQQPSYFLEFDYKTHKIVKKKIQLQKMKSSDVSFGLIMSDIKQLENIDTIKTRIQQKRIQYVKRLDTFRGLQQQILNLHQMLASAQMQGQNLQRLKQSKRKEISAIRQSYKQQKLPVYLNMQQKSQQKSPVQQSKSKVENPRPQDPNPSTIFAAMPSSCQRHPLGRHIQFHNGKKTLFLKNKNINDIDIKTMEEYDWTEVEILSLGGNNLTNEGVKYLNECSDWMNVIQLYLFANKITDISPLQFLGNMQILSLYDLQLNQASCNHIIKTKFPKLKQLYLCFEDQNADKLWQKIAASELSNCPKLQAITIDRPQKISGQTRVKLNKLCQKRGIKINFGNPSQNCVIY